MTRNPIKIQFFACFLAMLLAYAGYGQDTDLPRHQPINIKPTTDFDQRFYYVPGERQNVWGYRAGLLINDKYKLGIGGYFMNQYSNREITTTTLSRTTSDETIINKKLYLGTIYYEPYLLRRTLWETSLVLETGYGQTVNSETSEKDNSNLAKQTGAIVPVGIGLSVNLKLPAIFNMECFRWIGINAMAGYRGILYQHDKQNSYNGAYWSISGAVFLDRIVEDFHSWKKQRACARNNKTIKLFY